MRALPDRAESEPDSGPGPGSAPARPTFGIVAATLWFWGLFALTAPLCFVLGGLLFVVSAPFDPKRHLLHGFVCRWTFNYLRLSPLWRARVSGRERIPAGPVVFVANHQSMADVVAVMGLFHPYKFVSKASLFSLPLVGWLMRMMRYVSLERGRAGSTRAMMESCRGWLRRGVPVLIFPEGTYSAGKALLPFKRGAFVLAIEAGVPVVPVVLRGTSQFVQGDGPWLSARSDIRVEVLPPIEPGGPEADPDALSSRVRSAFTQALRKP